MKRILSTLLAMILCLGLLSSCKKQSDKKSSETTTIDKEEEQVIPPETVLHSSLYEYDLASYVKVGVRYEDLLLSQSFIDKAVEEDVQNFLSVYGTVMPYEDPETVAQNRDVVEVFYTGTPHDKSLTLSDEALAGMTNADSESGLAVTIGSGQLIGAYESKDHPELNNPGFEEQLIGHKKGDKFTINVTFPDDYGTPELESLPVDFEIEIVSVSYILEKELTVELLKKNTTYTSVEDFLNDSESYFKRYHTYEGLLDAVSVEGTPDEKLNKDTMIVEFLFNDLGLVLTQGEYEAMLKEHYEANAPQYLYYYGISTQSAFESIMGKDNLILFFEEEMVKDKLLEYVTMID